MHFPALPAPMRFALLCLLSVLLLGSALLAAGAPAWAQEPEAWQQGDVLRDASPCEVLEDEPDTVAEAVQTTVRLYQPPVTNDDRTELFWAPEEPRLNPAPAADAPSSGSQSARTAWPRPRLRPPRLA